MREFWPQYMPTKLNINDYRPCQFTTIFGEDFGASYYSLIWSEVIFKNLNLFSLSFLNKHLKLLLLLDVVGRYF